MDWTTILTGIGTVAGVGGLVYAILRNFKTDIFTQFNKKFDEIEKHINRIDNNMIAQGKRIDGLYTLFTETVRGQNQRTDHLYEICVELLRDRKNPPTQ